MLSEKAYKELFDTEDCPYKITLKYSGKFSGYNANVKMRGKYISFGLSSEWKGIDDDIQIGLLQNLMCKIFKKNIDTINIRLYHGFLKNVHVALPKQVCEPELSESFRRVNEKFFSGSMDISCLKWGNKSARLFGSYDYGTDTIKINPLLQGKVHLLDYVMYHEMLHKKHKFSSSNTRTFHHTPEFKRDENMYPGKKELEKELSCLDKTKIRATKLFHWF
ncbi:MAG: hypothetical protein ACOCQG_00545 [Candidatus Nanoarchaeia archaeon]